MGPTPRVSVHARLGSMASGMERSGSASRGSKAAAQKVVDGDSTSCRGVLLKIMAPWLDHSHPSKLLGTRLLPPPPPPQGTPAGVRLPIVYSHRRRNRTVAPTAELAASEVVAPQESFINKITKNVGTLLPEPKINKRWKKAPSSREPPRRNRRFAGLGAQPSHTVPSHSKRWVMRSLGFQDSQDLYQQAQDDYAKLFFHPLTGAHIQALASLFGWSIPKEQNGADMGADASSWWLVVCLFFLVVQSCFFQWTLLIFFSGMSGGSTQLLGRTLSGLL
jgi:hypothetical protein